MSEQNVEAVRQPIRISDGSHRRLEERIAARFPDVAVAANRALFSLRARSRIRRFLLLRIAHSGVEAANRGDYEVAFLFFHPEVELNWPDNALTLGPETLTGRDERIRHERRWRGEWGNLRYEPDELIDLKDRVLLVGHMSVKGISSGVVTESEWALLLTVSHGQVIREQVFFDNADALKAAGLEE